MMKRSFRSTSIGFALTLVLGMFAALSLGCGTIDANGFLGLETCDILNCDGLFFGNLADDHDDMAGMDDADAHDDGDDDHLDGVDDHDDDFKPPYLCATTGCEPEYRDWAIQDLNP